MLAKHSVFSKKHFLSIHNRCAKCAKCQIFGTFGTPNTKKHQISDVPNFIIFATCYSILTYLARYGHLWHMVLLFFYSSFSLIPIISFVFPFSYSPPPSPLSYTLSSSFFPLPFCSILFPFMNNEPPPISSLPSHKFHHH